MRGKFVVTDSVDADFSQEAPELSLGVTFQSPHLFMIVPWDSDP
jgi:hypothetical protein